MAKTVLQLQDHVARLESELELSKFLNKGVLQTNIEYKARVADLEYENDVLRKAESRLASTEEELEQAQAKAEQLEERLIEEEGRTQAALEREAATAKKLTAAERSRGTISFQDKLRKAEWEDVVRDLEDERDDWKQKYEYLSALLTPVVSALNHGKSIDLNPNRLKTSANGIADRVAPNGVHKGHLTDGVAHSNGTTHTNGINGVNGVNGTQNCHLANGNGRTPQPNGRATFARPYANQHPASRPAMQNRHSSPIRQKRKSGTEEDDNVFRPKSTPDRALKSSRVSGQGIKRRRHRQGDDWSDVDVKSEPDSDYDPLAM